MLHFRPTLVFKPLIPFRFILYLLPLLPHHRPLLLDVFLRLLPPLPPDSLRVLQWNAGGLRARNTKLLHFLSSHSVDICTQESNLNSSSSFRIPGFSGLIAFSALIAPTPDLAFSLLMPRTLAAASSFSSGRAHRSLNFLPALFPQSTPTLIMWGSTSLLTTPCYHFLMFTPSSLLLSDGWQNRFLFSLQSSLLQQSLHSGGLQLPLPLWDSRGTSDPHGEEVFHWVISSDFLPSMTLIHPPFYIAPLAVASLLTFPLFPLLFPFLAPGRCFSTWVLITYQFFYLSLSPRFFAPTSIVFPSTFRKLAGMTLPPTLTPSVLLQRNTRFFPFPLLLLSLLLWH